MSPISMQVRDLQVLVAATGHDIISDINFSISAGEVLALVGESGSGKTTAALALLGYARRGTRIAGGSVLVGERDLLNLDDRSLRRVRGAIVSYVPQDPATALNPARRIGVQLHEVLAVHGVGASGKAREERVAQLMAEVSLPADPGFLRRYPHELSGGQQQRVAIAMAFACTPAVVVLDEPTTGLDVSTQAHVLRTIRRITAAEGAAALYVSHDLSVVGSLADRVAVMYGGRLLEQGPAGSVFTAPGHPYTRMLLAAIPRLEAARELTAIPGRAPGPGAHPPGCPFAPRCPSRTSECEVALPEVRQVGAQHEVRCLHIDGRRDQNHGGGAVIPLESSSNSSVLRVEALRASYGRSEVVHEVGFSVAARQCVALVGESGSGKTTVARSVAGLHAQWSGQVLLDGVVLDPSVRRRTAEVKRSVQYVFQNPYGSLNPRRTVGQSVARPLSLLDISGAQARSRVAQQLEKVSLPTTYANRYPDELSGGERQRVAIARALICRPRVLLCDEITSALDISVQAAVVALLRELQEELGLALVFVTHNLALVRSIAQQVVVMQDGRVVESGAVDEVLDHPSNEYTQRLLDDAPRLGDAEPADG